ncbi:hypothetical protein LC605_15700 [Nostoc sp. CHAB 5836]|nr:hypothetical protein [Nostoc sp. CHAB 5836]
MQLIVAITLVNLTFKSIKQPLVSPTRKHCTTKEPILFTGTQLYFPSTVKNTGVCSHAVLVDSKRQMQLKCCQLSWWHLPLTSE